MRRNDIPRPTIKVQVALASAALLAVGIGVPVTAHEQRSGRADAVVEAAFAMPRGVAVDQGARDRGTIDRGGVDQGASGQGGWHGDEVGSFRPLAGADAARVREIFALQQAGQFEQAAAATGRLHNVPLLGDILADRYLSSGTTDQRSLREWLRRWDDLPDAEAIRHRLSDLSRGRTTLPAAAPEPVRQAATALPEEADPVEAAFTRNPLLDRTVQARIDQGAAGSRSALRLVAATRHIDPLYAAMLRAEIARALFSAGDDGLALRTAQTALRGSGGSIGLAAYVAGLSAWRQGQVPLALSFFEQASRAALVTASARAGAAFWAARAHRRLHQETAWLAWMQRAAASPHTFYGMLATRVLDQTTTATPVALADGMATGDGVLGEIDVEAVAATPEGWRAFALLQVGQPGRAEAALRQLWPRVQDDPALCRSIMLVARAAGMATLAAQLDLVVRARDDQPQDAEHFPMPRLRPHRGFTVNPALVYALTRLESNFDSKAVSGAGAHGLMQIMPVTASFVMGEQPGFRSARRLHDPAVNLEIGQRYLTYLAGQDGTHGDLIRLLASYNAGPNALTRWDDARADASGGDPLLFIEALPVRETRDFVHRALSYLWIYAGRMTMPAPSLDVLARGGWPRFDDEQKMARTRPEVVGAAP